MTDVDSDIAETVVKMNSVMEFINNELVPLLSALDEDKLVSHYSLAEQARINLSTAFTLAFSLYSLDKINNRVPTLPKSKLAAHDNVGMYCGGSTTDAQLVYKIERITDYIKKLKDITILSRRNEHREVTNDIEEINDETVDTTKQPQKRRKVDDKVKSARCKGESVMQEKKVGDDAMFALVTKSPGQTGNAVNNLIRHVNTEEEKKLEIND